MADIGLKFAIIRDWILPMNPQPHNRFPLIDQTEGKKGKGLRGKWVDVSFGLLFVVLVEPNI